MAPTFVPVTPSVLSWAMEQAAVTNQDVASRCKVDPRDVIAWQRGEAQPTKTQFNQLKALLRRPTAFFFLPEPPDQDIVPAAFRHPPGREKDRQLQRAESNSIRTARRLQKVSRWIVGSEELGQPRRLPRATLEDTPQTAAARARKFLYWTSEYQSQAKSASAAIGKLRERFEQFGILVLHQPLTEQGCRGFSLYDPCAPLIAINTAYTLGARLFSYGHELGHLVLQSDGICTNDTDYGVERWCEEFSAAFLMPASDVTRFILDTFGDRRPDPENLAKRVANYFKVSVRAAAIQLINFGYAEPELYRIISSNDHKTDSGGGGGEIAPVKRLREWGSTYPQLLLAAEERELLTRDDVLGYLNLTNTQLTTFRELLATGIASPASD